MVVKWTRQEASPRTVNITSFEEGLGRVMYVAGALEYERPFLGPLYRFLSLHPRNSPQVKFFLNHFACQLEVSRHHSYAADLDSWDVAPRVDAQASEDTTGIGCWAPVRNSRGELDPWLSLWFSHEITREEWPWVFREGRQAGACHLDARGLCSLFSLFFLGGDTPGEGRTKVQNVPTWTDNQGNGSALNKLMSRRFP